VDALPEWPEGTAAVLSTGAGHPHAIPVSTAVRVGPRTIHFALSLRRESLVRLRQDPRCALTVMARDVAFTALGRAVEFALDDRVTGLRLEVEEIQDHLQPTFAISAGVDWRWSDEGAARADAELRAALTRRRS
jgi:flavin reductase (DIM6/NTAB) family NADH-FMN oxidoreductase RutF